MVNTVKLVDMFRFVNSTFYECMKEEFAEDENGGYASSYFDNIVKGILSRNRSLLADAFADGFTSMMVPDFNENIMELRIIDEDTHECIMVFTRHELNW